MSNSNFQFQLIHAEEEHTVGEIEQYGAQALMSGQI